MGPTTPIVSILLPLIFLSISRSCLFPSLSHRPTARPDPRSLPAFFLWSVAAPHPQPATSSGSPLPTRGGASLRPRRAHWPRHSLSLPRATRPMLQASIGRACELGTDARARTAVMRPALHGDATCTPWSCGRQHLLEPATESAGTDMHQCCNQQASRRATTDDGVFYATIVAACYERRCQLLCSAWRDAGRRATTDVATSAATCWKWLCSVLEPTGNNATKFVHYYKMF